MSAVSAPNKRKMASSWHSRPVKKRKVSVISKTRWFRNKLTAKTPAKPVIKSSVKQYHSDDDDDKDDNDTFEIVPASNPRPNTIDPNAPINGSHASASPFRPKKNFATPSKAKHTEYNLKSLQESMTDSDQTPVEPTTTSTATAASSSSSTEVSEHHITTRRDIISTSSEWSKLGDINEHLIQHITGFMKLSHPTIIQTKSIPLLLERKDLLIKSETGSGKTLAYCIPIVSSLMAEVNDRKDGCKVMIIAPTRELSLQIYNVCNILCRHTPFIVIGKLMGGEDKKKEKQHIRKGLSIVIGTPGRILDHFENTRSFKFDLVKWFVLDEADILLRLGFEKFIRSIVKILDEQTSVMDRCNVLVSATLDARIQRLAQIVLNQQHVFISLNTGDDRKSDENDENTYVPATLQHHYVCIKREYQSVGLIGLLRMLYMHNVQKLDTFKVIIFMSTCSVVRYFYELFSDCTLFPKSKQKILPSKHGKNGEEISWFQLRGDMTQKDRTETFFRFCDVTNGVLLCTDVASRGLDIPKVNFIIQYDPPPNLQEYIHRSGRTARMGRAGQTMLFLEPKEMKYLDILKKNNFRFTQMSNSEIWNQLDIDYARYKLHTEASKEVKEEKERAHNPVTAMLRMDTADHEEKKKMSSSRNAIAAHLKKCVMSGQLKAMAKDALQTFVKAYTTYPRQMKHIFYVQNLDFYQCHRCFFLEREGKFLRKNGMRDQIKWNKLSQQKESMRDVAQKMTKKRNIPSTISEFAS